MTPKQISGYKSRLKRAITTCNDGAMITLELRSAEKIIEIIDKLIKLKEKTNGK